MAALALSSAISVGTPRLARADSPHYTIEPGVVLGRAMERTVARIAHEFHRRTGRGFVITSGTRTSREQAAAMYDKLRLGQRLTGLYQDYDAAAEIQTAYRANQRRSRTTCITAMARVIEGQVRRGCYISRHLRASAVDVRSRDMSRRERRIFEQVVASFPNVSLLTEGTPPHFHLQLR